MIGEVRAISREEKAVWRKLAATAQCPAIGFAVPYEAQATAAGLDKAIVYASSAIP
ncbi:TPA: hypothetical protein UM046_000081 [Stenotrophomonas maltophilia]|nr:hypothetical protein [Stenotrophomonas maltophilia]